MPKFDFKSIVTNTRRYNFHTHTQFCDGHNTIAEFCDAAEAMGFEHLGFSPHSPVPIDSPCNMAIEDVPRYIDIVRRMAEEHPSMHIYTSMEIDYLGDDWGPASPWFEALPLDYRIGSVHFIPDFEGKFVDIDGPQERFRRILAENFDGDLRTLVETFFNQSMTMVRTGGFELIGHYDKIAQNAALVLPELESLDWYRRRLDELTDLIIASGIAVEINTKAVNSHSRLFPNESQLQRLHKAGVTLVVNSDAHYCDRLDLCRESAFDLLTTA